MAIFTHPSYVPEFPSDTQVNGVFTLEADASLTVNMLGALVDLNGFILTVAPLSEAVTGLVRISGPGTLAGSATGTIAEDKAVTLVFAEGAVLLGAIPGQGTAATRDTGTAEGNVPLLGVGGKLADSVIPLSGLLAALGITSHANLAAANLALGVGLPYYDLALSTVKITTA